MKNHAAIVCVNDEEGNFRLLAHHLSVRATELREALLWALRTLPVGCPACGYRLDEPKRVECTEDHRNMAALLPAPDEVKS